MEVSTLLTRTSTNGRTPPRYLFHRNTMPPQEISNRCHGRVNHIFLATCIASLILQLYGAFASWNHAEYLFAMQGDGARRLGKGVPSVQDYSAHAVQQFGDSPIIHPPPSAMHEVNVMPDRLKYGPPKHSRRLRVLFGILTADFKNDQTYRKRHRTLFKLWADKRVCSLPDFKMMPLEERYECELIYTFVIGANPNATTELVDDSRPFEVARPIYGTCSDLNDPDVTLLNIRENMNEGKSQTWMYYGAQIAEEYDLDYVTKCDADSLLHLHEFFQFAYKNMPPAPYNKQIYIGALRDKAYWPRHATEEERIRYESYWGNQYEGVHLYVAGQIYIMSTDLARFTGEEAHHNQCSYCEGHEDHDISAMAFHSPDPIKLMVVGRSHRFWEHPVKGEPRWRRIFARETARVAGVPFEGKIFMADSTFETLYPDQ